MDQVITIVLTLGGPIMGTLVVVHEDGPAKEIIGFELHKPRAIVVTPVSGGQTNVSLAECIGQPDIIQLPADITYWTLKDKRLRAPYIQSITGILVVPSIPPRSGRA